MEIQALSPGSSANVGSMENHTASRESIRSGGDEQPTPKPNKFVPLSDEEAANLPELNFRPLALKFWYLMVLCTWMTLCTGGVATLAAMGKKHPTKLHLEQDYSYTIWLYSPGIIGFITTVLWRGTLRSYNRIVPYIRMANIPVGSASDSADGQARNVDVPTDILERPLIASSPGEEVNVGMLVSLWRAGDYMSFYVNLTVIFTILITPLKSGVFQLVEDDQGIQVHVSLGFCVAIILIYLWHLAVAVAVIWHLHNNKTGLRWNPCTLAAQMALIQGSDILDRLNGPSKGYPWDLRMAIRRWGRLGKALRLGYWRDEETGAIIHGVRFLTVREIPGAQPPPDEASPPQQTRHTENRFWNLYLDDTYLAIVTAIGVLALAATIVAWVKLIAGKPLNYVEQVSQTSKSVLAGAINSGSPVVLVRGIIFNLFPSLVYGLFNNTFLSSDLYRRTMVPVEHMAAALPEADHKRCLRGSNLDDADKMTGATAQDSMLLDYFSPDLITCVCAALGAKEWRLAYGAVLAALCNSVYVVVGRIFVFDDSDPARFTVYIQAANFFAALAIMALYLVSVWVLRPHGVLRTCRRIYTLVDFACLVHQSPLRECPEFWVQGLGDTEDHMKAQVVLADRVYRFGIYEGVDGGEHLGVSIHGVPETWARNPGEGSIPALQRSVGVARHALQRGVDDEAVELSQTLLNRDTRLGDKVRPNEYRSWRRRVMRTQKWGSDRDSNEEVD